MVRFFVRVRVIRHQAEVIQVGCDSFQHADYPRAVESNKLRLEIFIGPKIHDHVFATLQSLQPISAAFAIPQLLSPNGIGSRFPTQAVRLFSFHRNLGSIGSARLESPWLRAR